MNYKKCILLNFITAVIISLVLMSVGCELIEGYKVSSTGNGCNLFVLKKGIGHFSFEYLAKYNLDIVETRTDQYHYTNVNFDDWDHKTEIQFTSFDIFIDGDKDVSNAEAMLYEDISYWSKEDEYSLLDLSPVTVSGISGQQYLFTYKMPEIQASEASYPTPPCTWINKDIYFDYGGVVWSIGIQSPLLNGKSEIDDLGHIVQTFKILN